MSAVLQFSIAFEQETCCACGVVYYVTGDYQRRRLADKASFYCPNGHPQSYTDSEADRLRKQLAAEQKARQWEKDRAESMARRMKQAEGKLKGFRKRVAAGVCPCCQRTVSQLAAHMKSKHPDFAGEPKP